MITIKLGAIYFNSQPHEEADKIHAMGKFHLQYFNSQPHEEADGNSYMLLRRMDISTHSLTKRLTRTEDLPPELEKYFNSQPHEEADPLK